MTLGARFTRLRTGAKIFLILSAALLPFAIIAILATLSTTRQAGLEARAQLRVAAQESSRNLAIELGGDMTALTAAMDALAIDSGDALSCARVRGVFAQQSASGASVAIADRSGRILCGSPPPYPAPDAVAGGPRVARVVVGKGVMLAAANADGTIRGSAFFPIALLARIGRPSAAGPDYAETIRGADGQQLTLHTLDRDAPLDSHPSVAVERMQRQLLAVGAADRLRIIRPGRARPTDPRQQRDRKECAAADRAVGVGRCQPHALARDLARDPRTARDRVGCGIGRRRSAQYPAATVGDREAGPARRLLRVYAAHARATQRIAAIDRQRVHRGRQRGHVAAEFDREVARAFLRRNAELGPRFKPGLTRGR